MPVEKLNRAVTKLLHVGAHRVRKTLQRPAVRPTDAAAFPPDTATPADPFSVIQTLTTVSELGGSTQGRRLQQSRTRRSSPILGAVVKVRADTAAGRRVLWWLLLNSSRSSRKQSYIGTHTLSQLGCCVRSTAWLLDCLQVLSMTISQQKYRGLRQQGHEMLSESKHSGCTCFQLPCLGTSSCCWLSH